jgi:hypothetical protein
LLLRDVALALNAARAQQCPTFPRSTDVSQSVLCHGGWDLGFFFFFLKKNPLAPILKIWCIMAIQIGSCLSIGS